MNWWNTIVEWFGLDTKEEVQEDRPKTPKGLTPNQINHLRTVYTTRKHGVKTYKDLTAYCSKKYGIDMAVSTLYKQIKT